MPADHELTAPTYTRLRITFATEKTLAYISVLDLGRIWERSLRRAGVPLRYSQGFNPRPKLQFAAPLPTGGGGAAEWLDIWLEEAWEPARVAAALSGRMPADLTVVDIVAVPEAEPALSEQITTAEYRLWLREVEPERVAVAVASLLAADSLPRPKRGRRSGRTYDLRPLVESLTVIAAPAPWTAALHIRLTARPSATGRPDEVLSALGLDDVPRRCTRMRLEKELQITS